jgi:hypothetical protein
MYVWKKIYHLFAEKKHAYIMRHTLQTQTFVYSKYCQQFHKNCPCHDFGPNCNTSDEEYDESD